ncbi:MAG: FG-GAP-like repeat-containing protein [Saprospiraceae bacterium]|nr:FG-GAP-like repeat-containing protein [Saprospiraceae bacterium]
MNILKLTKTIASVILFIVFLFQVNQSRAQYTPAGQAPGALWFNASQGVNTNANNAVTSWNDLFTNQVTNATGQGGNSNTDRQLINIFDGGTVEGVRIDGGNDYFSLTNALDINDAPSYEKKMFFAVVRTPAILSGRELIWEQGGGTNGFAILTNNDDLFVTAWHNMPGGSNYVASTNNIQPNTEYIITLYFDANGEGLRGYLNGIPFLNNVAGTTTNPIPRHPSTPNLGGNTDNIVIETGASQSPPHFSGYIGAYLQYNEEASQTKRILVENVLAHQYNIPIIQDYYSSNTGEALIGIGRFSGADFATSAAYDGGQGLSLYDFNYMNANGDYVLAAHNGATGTASDGGNELHSNRTWAVEATNQGSPNGQIRVCFDPSALDPVLMGKSITTYYLRINGIPSPVSASYLGNRIAFLVDVSSIDGADITLGVSDVTTLLGICEDGIDNDGDGLIDCYDTDGGESCGNGMSPVCDNFYFGNTPPDCEAILDTTANNFNLGLQFQTDQNLYPADQRSGVFVMDMNSDGTPDMVTIGNSTLGNKAFIFDGATGNVIQTFNLTGAPHPYIIPCLADTDNDGSGELFLTNNNRQLACYEYGNSNPVWITANGQVFSQHQSAQVADFDNDGTAEVYVGNAIFDASTGTRLVAYANGQNSGRVSTASGAADAYPIAFDLDGDNDLELIAGNVAYDINLGNGTANNGSRSVYSSVSGTNINDGFTSIADIDANGTVDVVVTSRGYVYVWEPSTTGGGTNSGTLLTTARRHHSNSTLTGRANLGDFDNDGIAEIGIYGSNRYKVYEYNAGSPGTLSVLWERTSLDDGSGMTGSSLFDFEADGRVEVVYSDEEHLFIWDGATGVDKTVITARAGTRTEYPLVVDVDADGQAEIVLTVQTGNGPSNTQQGWIAVYGSGNTPWASARRVWNQHGFFNTNINDNGTVPIVQQNHVALGGNMNSFIAQPSLLDINGDPIIPALDFVISFDPNTAGSVNQSSCPNSLGLSMQVSNEGDFDILSEYYISYYHNDPKDLSDNPIYMGTDTFNLSIAVGDTLQMPTIWVPLVNLSGSNGANDANVYFVVNDAGPGLTPGTALTDTISLPNTGLGECSYDNNIYGPFTLTDCGTADLDADDDGIPDLAENYTGDADNDGTPDFLDNDFCLATYNGISAWDCADGLPIPGADLDFDGVPNYRDADFPACGGLVNGVCANFDFDGDGIANHLDLDSDNDGISDLIEAGGVDTDGDGLADNIIDTDGDGLIDLFDNDDTDGILGSSPCAPQMACLYLNSTSTLLDIDSDGTIDNLRDMDSDGRPNYQDLDSDNDGISDLIEVGGVDADGDGVADNLTDLDNDGFVDIYDPDDDGTPGIDNGQDPLVVTSGNDVNNNGVADDNQNYLNGENAPTDHDGDRLPNFLDLDSDNDGISDILEVGGTDADHDGMVDGTVDADNDGFMDDVDPDDDGIAGIDDPNDPFILTSGIDADADGKADDGQDFTNGSGTLFLNLDNDNLPHFLDLDSDNDGIADIVENNAGLISTDIGGGTFINGQIGDLNIIDSNNDGWHDPSAGVSTPFADADGDGIPNMYDLDSDSDGVLDHIEGVCTGCVGSMMLIPTGVDANQNGFLDMYENLNATNDGIGINDGVNPNDDDDDNDGIPDFLDIDADDHGEPDWSEAFDINTTTSGLDDLTQMAVDYETANGNPNDYSSLDSDGDGLPDWIDNQPNTIGYNPTIVPPFLDPNNPAYIDVNNNGIADLVDPYINGSTFVPTPNSDGSGDDDWRDPITLLGFEFIAFDIQLQNKDAEVFLTWTVARDETKLQYIIEHSHNNTHFKPILEVNGQQAINEITTYNAVDYYPQTGYNYYRIQVVDLDGTFLYSAIQVVNLKEGESGNITIAPNPVKDQANLVFSDLEGQQIDVEVWSIHGQKLLTEQFDLQYQKETQVLRGLDQLSTGTYLVRVLVRNTGIVLTRKLIKQ